MFTLHFYKEVIKIDDSKMINYIIRQLKENHITLQRYDSLTSKSVYLKMDLGVLKSIRINNHKGKKHLHYRYNLQSNIKSSHYDRRNKRFYYTYNDVDKMIEQILSDRKDKLNRYKNKYYEYMQKNANDNGHRKGFWEESVFI